MSGSASLIFLYIDYNDFDGCKGNDEKDSLLHSKYPNIYRLILYQVLLDAL